MSGAIPRHSGSSCAIEIILGQFLRHYSRSLRSPQFGFPAFGKLLARQRWQRRNLTQYRREPRMRRMHIRHHLRPAASIFDQGSARSSPAPANDATSLRPKMNFYFRWRYLTTFLSIDLYFVLEFWNSPTLVKAHRTRFRAGLSLLLQVSRCASWLSSGSKSRS
jgi:hypothetical protein